jgi:FkbM family methyltransferase
MKKPGTWLKLIRVIGLRDALLITLFKALKREVILPVSISGEKLHIRTATSDLRVALSCLADGEYRDIRCENPSVIVDAGANIGASTIFFARRYPQAMVYAIEPEQGNFALLARNTSHLSNVVPIRAALWGCDETREVHNRLSGHWGYTIAETGNRTEATGQEIRCITLATLIEQYGAREIDLLKVDIEGGEKAVFESSGPWINKVRIITVELHDRICAGCTDAFATATAHFKRVGKGGEKVTAYRD